MTSFEERILQSLDGVLPAFTVFALYDTFYLAFLASLTASMLIVVTGRWHGNYSFDKDVHGIQKVHSNPVPRTGGIAMFTGILAIPVFSLLKNTWTFQDVYTLGIFKLLLAAIPAVMAGIFEDLTKNGSVKLRLFATFVSALLAAWLLGAYLPRIDTIGLDFLLQFLPLSLLVTSFAVAGVTNSVNIIDGFHGVAGGSVAVMLAGTGYLAWQSGDVFVTQLAVAGLGATIGFLLLNYPTGRLFMGDGGAYLLGFWAAEVAVLTIVRNPEINAWQILAIFAYPVIEVVFSMYRRKFVRKVCVGAPDRLHLHSLFYRRVACMRLPRTVDYPWIRNAAVACFVSAWIATMAVLAIWIGNTVASAVALVLFQALAYMAFYTRLVRGHWCRCVNPAVIFGWRSEPRSPTA